MNNNWHQFDEHNHNDTELVEEVTVAAVVDRTAVARKWVTAVVHKSVTVVEVDTAEDDVGSKNLHILRIRSLV